MLKTLNKILITFSTIALFAGSSFAQAAAPLNVEYSSLPGEVVKGQITVLNTSDESQTITLTTDDFQQEPKVDSMQQWIVIPQSSFLVESKQKVVIPYEIHIPIDAPSQGYYGALKVQSSSSNEAETAHLIMLEVEGDTHQNLSLQDFSVDKDSIAVQITNTGNIHSSPEGVVDLVDSRGYLLEEYELNKEDNVILPQNTKTYLEDSYIKNLPAGIYYAVVNGKAENGQQLQGKLTFQLDRTGKIEIIDKYIGAVDTSFLKGSAQSQYIVFQTVLSVLAVFIFAIAFLAIGRYCIVSSKAFKKNKR